MREALLALFFAVVGGYIVELLKESSDKIAYGWLRLLGALVPWDIKEKYVAPWLGEAMDMEESKVAKFGYALQVTGGLCKILVQREIALAQPIATAMLVLPIALCFWPSFTLFLLTPCIGFGFLIFVSSLGRSLGNDRRYMKRLILPFLLYGVVIGVCVLGGEALWANDLLRVIGAPGLFVLGLLARQRGLFIIEVYLGRLQIWRWARELRQRRQVLRTLQEEIEQLQQENLFLQQETIRLQQKNSQLGRP
ncbi:hypothetical protein [Deinococcus sp. QL22]|uniref:hypothetical protein n=1 Tax=Deinococcus sp. QL22 TaxID=2939437 RepID=UPI002017965A|nr:hypothetical protein [Deinococcus sp. QL22]UQN10580.1 hypothetical protein M1R55_30745 [Deinococcus sp. QL22]